MSESEDYEHCEHMVINNDTDPNNVNKRQPNAVNIDMDRPSKSRLSAINLQNPSICNMFLKPTSSKQSIPQSRTSAMHTSRIQSSKSSESSQNIMHVLPSSPPRSRSNSNDEAEEEEENSGDDDDDKSHHSLEDVADDFPYNNDGTIQLSYLPIALLIALAAHLNVTITKTANKLQCRQRHAFINKVNNCKLPYGYKQKTMEYIANLEVESTITAVAYEPSIEFNYTSDLTITKLNLPPSDKQFSYDVTNTSSNINVHLTLILTSTVQDALIIGINNQLPIKDLTIETVNNASCFTTAITVLKPITAVPSDNYGANQILTIMMSTNISHNVQPNLNLLDTTNKCISLLSDMRQDLEQYNISDHTCSKYITPTSLRLTINKVKWLKEFMESHQQSLITLQQSISVHPPSPTATVHKQVIPRTAIFHVLDLHVIQQCTSLNVQFCIREKQLYCARYTLLASNDNGYFTRQQVVDKLAVHIICCEQSNDGNLAGVMSLCAKIMVPQPTILSAIKSLSDRTSTAIARLPVVNPLMNTQQIAANQTAISLTSTIETPAVFTHICIHGLPDEYIENRNLLAMDFCRLDITNPGIGMKLGIPDPNRYGPLIRLANSGLLFDKILVSTQFTSHYNDGKSIIVFKLFRPISTPIPWRTTSMVFTINSKSSPHLLAATFINEDLASQIISSQEVLVARPLPEEYTTPACVALRHMYQPKTSQVLHPIIMSSYSKVRLQSRDVLSNREVVCVLIIIDQVDEHFLQDLRRNMMSKKNEPSTVYPIPSMRFQVAPTMRSLSYIAYPPSMTTQGNHKYIIFRKYKDTLNATRLCELIQLHLPTISHHFVLLFIAPLLNNSISLIIITDGNADINILTNQLRAMIIDHQLSSEEFPLLETSSVLPGHYSRNKLLLNDKPTVALQHPKETSSFTQVASKTSNSSSMNNTRSSNKQQKSPINVTLGSSQSTLTSYYSTTTVPPAPPPSTTNN